MTLSSVPYPTAIMYAALGGTALALLWATAVNKWSLKVFFLLALRLAIGWHFLFEGLHKLHSHHVGASETSRPFSSEMYFVVGEGPAATLMRKKLGDPEEQLAAKVSDEKVPEPLKTKIPADQRRGRGPEGETAEEYTRQIADPETAVRDEEQFAKMVPPAVAKDWDDFVTRFAEKYHLTADEKKKIDAKLETDERAQLLAARKAATIRNKGGKLGDSEKAELKTLAEQAGKLPGDLGLDAMAAYGRWVAGVEGRDAKVKYVSGTDPQWTAPQRLEYITHRKAELDAIQKRSDTGLGHGYGYDQKKLTELKQTVTTARADLIKDADAFLTDLKSGVVTTILAARFEAKAAGPSRILLDDEGKVRAEKVTALFPPEKAADQPVSFNDLPADVKVIWEGYYKEFKATYPLDDAQAAKADEAFRVMGTRLANWYFDRDEYSGRPAPGKGFAGIAKKYTRAAERQKAAEEALKALPPFTPPAAPPPAPKKEEPTADLAAGGIAGALARAAQPPKKAQPAAPPTGPGFGYSLARASALAADAQAKTDAAAAPAVAAAALEAKFTDLKAALVKELPAEAASGPVTVKPDRSFIQRMDVMTMWGIFGIGALLLAGLFTRLAALAGAMFLVMTYLTHPPFPWLPLPPGTEGNPVYVNKNAIEALALLVIMVHPTGRWLGIDAFLHRIFFRNSKDYAGPPKRVRKTPPAAPGKPVTGRA